MSAEAIDHVRDVIVLRRNLAFQDAASAYRALSAVQSGAERQRATFRSHMQTLAHSSAENPLPGLTTFHRLTHGLIYARVLAEKLRESSQRVTVATTSFQGAVRVLQSLEAQAKAILDRTLSAASSRSRREQTSVEEEMVDVATSRLAIQSGSAFEGRECDLSLGESTAERSDNLTLDVASFSAVQPLEAESEKQQKARYHARDESSRIDPSPATFESNPKRDRKHCSPEVPQVVQTWHDRSVASLSFAYQTESGSRYRLKVHCAPNSTTDSAFDRAMGGSADTRSVSSGVAVEVLADGRVDPELRQEIAEALRRGGIRLSRLSVVENEVTERAGGTSGGNSVLLESGSSRSSIQPRRRA